MNNLKNIDQFLQELASSFPQIRDEVFEEDYEGLITLQVGCFRKFTQEAIDRRDLNIVADCFSFVNENIGKVDHKIENALYISYLGKLNITRGSKIEKLLPNELKASYNDLINYQSTPSKNNKLNDFLRDI